MKKIYREIVEELKNIYQDVRIFLKWLIIASIMGTILGFISVLFHHSVELATELRHENSWLLYLLPVGGIVIAWLYKVSGMETDPGTNLVLTSVRSLERIRFKTAPLVFIGTVITHLVGGSSGREGAALQMGGSIASTIGERLHMDEKDHHIMVMCGMAAAFSGLFGTPLTAAVFSMEVISVGVMYYAALIPCTVGALVGFGIAELMGVPATSFPLSGIPELSVTGTVQVMILAALCALLSAIFCLAMHTSGKLYKKYIPNTILRAAIGGLIVLLLTLLIGTQDYNGAGVGVIVRATQGEAHPAAFLLKILFTAITLGAGFKGGEIVPTFFIGSTFGCVVGDMLGLDPSFAAGVGLIALFCGVLNCPMASLILSLELFGSDGVLYFAVASATSYMLSGYYGLYKSQKILYSKTKPEYINSGTR